MARDHVCDHDISIGQLRLNCRTGPFNRPITMKDLRSRKFDVELVSHQRRRLALDDLHRGILGQQ